MENILSVLAGKPIRDNVLKKEPSTKLAQSAW